MLISGAYVVGMHGIEEIDHEVILQSSGRRCHEDHIRERTRIALGIDECATTCPPSCQLLQDERLKPSGFSDSRLCEHARVAAEIVFANPRTVVGHSMIPPTLAHRKTKVYQTTFLS
jgi:hypothetical protein